MVIPCGNVNTLCCAIRYDRGMSYATRSRLAGDVNIFGDNNPVRDVDSTADIEDDDTVAR